MTRAWRCSDNFPPTRVLGCTGRTCFISSLLALQLGTERDRRALSWSSVTSDFLSCWPRPDSFVCSRSTREVNRTKFPPQTAMSSFAASMFERTLIAHVFYIITDHSLFFARFSTVLVHGRFVMNWSLSCCISGKILSAMFYDVNGLVWFQRTTGHVAAPRVGRMVKHFSPLRAFTLHLFQWSYWESIFTS